MSKETIAFGYSIKGLRTLDTVYDSGSNVVRETEFDYDQSTPTASSGVPQHTSVTGARGNLTEEKFYLSSSASIPESFTYEDTGSLLTSTDPSGATTTYTYDPSTFVYNTGVAYPTPSSGVALSTSATFDTNYSGLPLTFTDMNTQQSKITSYDSSLRPTEADFPDGGKTTWSYTPTSATTNVYQTSNTYSTAETELDGYGRKSRVFIANGQSGNSWYQQDFCYDANGNLSFVSYEYQGTGPGSSKKCSTGGDSYSYDALGRVISVSHADGTSVNYTYYGRAVMGQDENNVTRITQSDGMGRPTIVCEITSTTMQNSGSPANCGTDIAGTGYSTTYSYTLSTGTTTITQGAQTRTFQTDWLGRTTSVTEPERGTTTYSYAYNSTGLQVTRTRPQANQTNPFTLTTTTKQYDTMGRPINISYSDGTPTRYFAYDSSADWSQPQSNLKGHLSNVSSPIGISGQNAATIFSYDPMGRIAEMVLCLPSSCQPQYVHTLAYTYDLAGNLLSSTDGTSVTSTYTYSLADELTSLASSLSNTTNPPNLIPNVQNGPNGPISYSLGNGLTVVPWYDSIGRYTGGWTCNGSSTHNCNGGTEIQGSLVGWKGTETTEVCEDNPDPNQCSNTGFDEFGRLNALTTVTGTTNNYTYAYDRYGNRWNQTQVAGSGGFNVALSFDSANHISTNGYTYDAAGNMTDDGFHSYTYDAEGNITQVSGGGTTAQYSYDALNNRVRAVVNGTATEFVFNASGQRVSIWNGSTYAQIQGQYYWGSQPVAFYENGTLHFQHQNWLGTERVQTDYSGNIEYQYGNLPFGDGETTTSGSAATDAYHFAALDHDSETDTDHAVFRQYNDTQGRWMSPDPYDGSYDPTNPQSFDRYAYVLNNPLAATDRTGLLHCIKYVTCLMGNMSDDGTDPGGEFFFVDWVSAGSGAYGYSDSVWQAAMPDGPGGGNTIDDSTGIIYDAAGDPVGQTWTSFSSAGSDTMPNGTVQIGQNNGSSTCSTLSCHSALPPRQGPVKNPSYGCMAGVGFGIAALPWEGVPVSISWAFGFAGIATNFVHGWGCV